MSEDLIYELNRFLNNRKYSENKNYDRAYAKKYRMANKEKFSLYNRRWRLNNLDYMKEWRKNNQDKIKIYKKKERDERSNNKRRGCDHSKVS